MKHDDSCNSGSGSCYVGLLDSQTPREIPTIVGYSRYSGSMSGVLLKNFYMGEEASLNRGILELKHPIENGDIVDWENMEKLWIHFFHDIVQKKQEETRVVLVLTNHTNPETEKIQKERISHIFFEKFKVPSLSILSSPVCLVSFSTSSSQGTGMVVEVGESVMSVSSVFDGVLLPQCCVTVPFGGRDVTNCLKKFLEIGGKSFENSEQYQIVKDIKETKCFVAVDYWREMEHNSQEELYTLPDHQTMVLKKERFQAPEILFRPSLVGMKFDGISEMVISVLRKLNEGQARALLSNIILGGGSTMLNGFPERLESDLHSMTPPGSIIKVIAPPERQETVWKGAATLGREQNCKKWITRQEYLQFGPNIVHSK